MKRKLLIIGAGELGKQILHYSKIDGRYEVVGFSDKIIKPGEIIDGKPVLCSDDDILQLYQDKHFDCLVIGIGYNHFKLRDHIYEEYKGKIPFATIIANPIHIDETAKIGEGCVVYPGCIIDRNSIIEPNVILNTGVGVGHASKIGQSSFLAGNVIIGGFAVIGKRCFLGIQSAIKDNIKISDDIFLGIGSIVIRNLKKVGTYFGNPAKRIDI